MENNVVLQATNEYGAIIEHSFYIDVQINTDNWKLSDENILSFPITSSDEKYVTLTSLPNRGFVGDVPSKMNITAQDSIINVSGITAIPLPIINENTINRLHITPNLVQGSSWPTQEIGDMVDMTFSNGHRKYQNINFKWEYGNPGPYEKNSIHNANLSHYLFM